jgi:hypothetical protein
MGWRAEIEREQDGARVFKRRPLRERMSYYLRGAFLTAALLTLLVLYVRASLFG